MVLKRGPLICLLLQGCLGFVRSDNLRTSGGESHSLMFMEDSCDYNETYRYANRDKEKFSCRNLTKNKAKKEKWCNKKDKRNGNKPVSHFCRRECLQNDNRFRLKVRKKKRNCKWLTSTEYKANKFCDKLEPKSKMPVKVFCNSGCGWCLQNPFQYLSNTTDTIPPNVRIAGDLVKNTDFIYSDLPEILVKASDNVDKKVNTTLYIDGEKHPIGQVKELTIGPHIAQAVAMDTAGNIGYSNPVVFNILKRKKVISKSIEVVDFSCMKRDFAKINASLSLNKDLENFELENLHFESLLLWANNNNSFPLNVDFVIKPNNTGYIGEKIYLNFTDVSWILDCPHSLELTGKGGDDGDLYDFSAEVLAQSNNGRVDTNHVPTKVVKKDTGAPICFEVANRVDNESDNVDDEVHASLSMSPQAFPTIFPQASLSSSPSVSPQASPTASPSSPPSISPSASPSTSSQESPSMLPFKTPSTYPQVSPSTSPSSSPSVSPQASPTASPSSPLSISPSASPSVSPQESPSTSPSTSPSKSPSTSPSRTPSTYPKVSPSISPSSSPTFAPDCPCEWKTELKVGKIDNRFDVDPNQCTTMCGGRVNVWANGGFIGGSGWAKDECPCDGAVSKSASSDAILKIWLEGDEECCKPQIECIFQPELRASVSINEPGHSFAGGAIDIASTCSGKTTAVGAVAVGENIRPTFNFGINASVGPKGPSVGGSIGVKTTWSSNDNTDDTFRGNSVAIVNKPVVIVSVVSKVMIDLLADASIFNWYAYSTGSIYQSSPKIQLKAKCNGKSDATGTLNYPIIKP